MWKGSSNQTLLIALGAIGMSACSQGIETEERTPGDQSRTPGLMITGRATVKVMPDLFEIEGTAFSEASDRIEALETVSAQLSVLTSELPALEGLTKLEITTSEAQVNSIRPRGCDETGYSSFERPQNCDPIAEYARVTFKITGQPVEAAGDAIAFVSALNFEDVEFAGFQVSDPASAHKEAQSLALKDAINRASLLAEGTGGELGKLLSVSDRDYKHLQWDEFVRESALASIAREGGSRSLSLSSRVDLFMHPEPQKFDGEIHAHFEIAAPEQDEE